MSALLQLAHDAVASLPADVPNPPATPPKDLEGVANELIGYLKWGVIVVIVMGGLAGLGGLVVGRVLSHHRSSQWGMTTLLVSIVAACLLPVFIPFMNSLQS